MRDFIYDDDRCRAHVRHLPRDLSCLTNAAIAIVRCDGRLRFLPEAKRVVHGRTAYRGRRHLRHCHADRDETDRRSILGRPCK